MPVSLTMVFTKQAKTSAPTEFRAPRSISAPTIASPAGTRAFRGSMFQNIQSSKKCGSCGGFK